MAHHRRYDDDFRASAVLLVEGAGYPHEVGAIWRVAKHLNIPESTLRGWVTGAHNPPPAKVHEAKKQDFLSQLQAIRGLAADKIVERIEEYDPRDLTGLLKISTELAQLLSGEPIVRIETVQKWLDELPEEEYESVIAEAERIIRAGGGADS